MKLPYKVKDLKSVQKNFDFLVGKLLTAAGPYTNPTRVFATDYQPNTKRPTLVVVSILIVCNNAEGIVDLFCGPGATPTTFIGRVYGRNLLVGSSDITGSPITFICPAGYIYRMVTTTVIGAPAFSVQGVAELTL